VLQNESLALQYSTINLNEGIWYIESILSISSKLNNGSINVQLSLSTTTDIDTSNTISATVLFIHNYKSNNKITGVFKITEDTTINTNIIVLNGLAYDTENNKIPDVSFTLETTPLFIATRIA
jgi:hypothetical protein